MKLLYATSIVFPSGLANRLQILATFEALYRQAPESVLGVSQLVGEVAFPVTPFPGSTKSPLLGLRYALYMRQHHITHLFCREDYLLFFIILWSKILGNKAKYFFEAHKMHDGWAFPYIIKWVDGIVSITNGLKEDLVAVGCISEQIVVVPDAVDLKRFEGLAAKEELRTELGIPLDKKVVAYPGGFGGMHPWKGADVLLEAAVRADESLHFILVGGRPNELAQLGSTYSRENIRIEGQWAPSEVVKLLRAADVLVLPNKSGYVMSERHTSPMKLFEYMASGTPILASDLPSIREIVSEADVLFMEPNNSESLLVGLEDIFLYTERASARARSALQKVQVHTWDARARAILAFLGKEG